MAKTYNTPKRNHIVKTRLDDEEYADFLRRLEIYDMNQSEFIREAISAQPSNRPSWQRWSATICSLPLAS